MTTTPIAEVELYLRDGSRVLGSTDGVKVIAD